MSETKKLPPGVKLHADEDTTGQLHSFGRLDPEKVRRTVEIGRQRGWLKGPTVTATPKMPWESSQHYFKSQATKQETTEN